MGPGWFHRLSLGSGPLLGGPGNRKWVMSRYQKQNWKPSREGGVAFGGLNVHFTIDLSPGGPVCTWGAIVSTSNCPHSGMQQEASCWMVQECGGHFWHREGQELLWRQRCLTTNTSMRTMIQSVIWIMCPKMLGRSHHLFPNHLACTPTSTVSLLSPVCLHPWAFLGH